MRNIWGCSQKQDLVGLKLDFGKTIPDLKKLADGWNDSKRKGDQKLILLDGSEQGKLIIKRFQPNSDDNKAFARWLTNPIPGEEKKGKMRYIC